MPNKADGELKIFAINSNDNKYRVNNTHRCVVTTPFQAKTKNCRVICPICVCVFNWALKKETRTTLFSLDNISRLFLYRHHKTIKSILLITLSISRA